MAASKDKLIRQFVMAIREGNAAIFAGAGLSRASGYADWKTFLKPLAGELGLEKENRRADVKMDSDQLSDTLSDRDAVVYKMHGDADHPANAVLTPESLTEGVFAFL